MFDTINIDEVSRFLANKEKYDLFICFSSFEKRSISLASHVPIDKFQNFLIFSNSAHLENEKENLAELTRLFSSNPTVVELDLSDPIDVADNIIDTLNILNNRCKLRKVLVDITTFTHEVLLIILAILNTKFPDAEIMCGYINADEYSIEQEEESDKWLSRGIGNVRTVLGYSGDHELSKENALIVIVGYEYERAVRIIDAIEPDFLTIGYSNGDSSTTKNNYDANAGYAQLVKSLAAYYEQTPDFVIYSNDPYKTFEAIKSKLKLIENEKNVTIVPMNNKISTVGIAMIGLAYPKVQICYAPALVYNTSAYSKPGDTCFFFPFRIPQDDE